MIYHDLLPVCRVLQAMVDRVVPVFMQRLLEDYYNWTVEAKPQDVPVSDITISPAVPNSDHKSLEDMPLWPLEQPIYAAYTCI